MTARCHASIVVLLALGGCLPTWVSPTREDAARLTFVSEVNLGGTYVTPYVFQEGRECRGQTKVGLPGLGNLGEKFEIRIPPGEEFTVLANVRAPRMFCNIVASFLPKPRESYAAVISGSPSRCKMAILRSNGRALEPEPSVRKRALTARATSSEAQCTGDAPSAP